VPWLGELYNKLWGREDLFHQVFRAVDLIKEDFVELQSELHHLNPSRNLKNYLAKKVLKTKMDFLRSRTATRSLGITTDSLVPKVVLIKKQEDKDNNEEDAKFDVGDEDTQYDGNVEDESENVDEDDKSYIDEDAAFLSRGPAPVLPCTIRYMDLTCLNLKHFYRVSQVLLIRDKWDAVVDIFNKKERGKGGSAIWRGEPGTGKQHYSPWIQRLIQRLRLITLSQGKTALLYYILVICLIKAQPFVFQEMFGGVYIINDEAREQMGGAGQGCSYTCLW